MILNVQNNRLRTVNLYRSEAIFGRPLEIDDDDFGALFGLSFGPKKRVLLENGKTGAETEKEIAAAFVQDIRRPRPI